MPPTDYHPGSLIYASNVNSAYPFLTIRPSHFALAVASPTNLGTTLSNANEYAKLEYTTIYAMDSLSSSPPPSPPPATYSPRRNSRWNRCYIFRPIPMHDPSTFHLIQSLLSLLSSHTLALTPRSALTSPSATHPHALPLTLTRQMFYESYRPTPTRIFKSSKSENYVVATNTIPSPAL